MAARDSHQGIELPNLTLHPAPLFVSCLAGLAIRFCVRNQVRNWSGRFSTDLSRRLVRHVPHYMKMRDNERQASQSCQGRLTDEVHLLPHLPSQYSTLITFIFPLLSIKMSYYETTPKLWERVSNSCEESLHLLEVGLTHVGNHITARSIHYLGKESAWLSPSKYSSTCL